MPLKQHTAMPVVLACLLAQAMFPAAALLLAAEQIDLPAAPLVEEPPEVAAKTGSIWERWAFGFEHSRYDWIVREYDNVWLLSKNYPHEGLEDRYLDLEARTEATFLTLGYRLTDAVEVKGKIGVMKGGEEVTNEDPGEYDQESAWGLDVNARIWESAGRAIAIDGGFHYENGTSSDWKRRGTPYRGDIETWGLDLLSAWTVKYSHVSLSVLAGLSYTDLQLPYEHDSDPGLPDRQGGFEAEDRFGGAVGVRLEMPAFASLTILQRFGATDGMGVAVSFSL
jgi:hypothetical protein